MTKSVIHDVTGWTDYPGRPALASQDIPAGVDDTRPSVKKTETLKSIFPRSLWFFPPIFYEIVR